MNTDVHHVQVDATPSSMEHLEIRSRSASLSSFANFTRRRSIAGKTEERARAFVVSKMHAMKQEELVEHNARAEVRTD